MNEEFSTRYNPVEVEDKWYRYWEDNGFFHADAEGKGKSYCIVIPPPNVTGILHMGHALNNTLQDILVRYHRMLGEEALWLPGTDHAGIATQNVVEKSIAKDGISRHDLGREKLIERIWEWKDEFGGTILGQLRKLGCSCDWERTRFTLDDGLSRAVTEVFVKLYREGLIYRGKYLVNWCPRCRTALSDDEVEHEERVKSHLWYVQYPLKDGSGHITVATTRPETMLGDTAVAVNPGDERFAHLIGKTLVLPLVGREIEIIADDFVDPAFGTGLVKVTPAHDPNDFEIGNRHDLERINVMTEDGVMNENAGQYAGLDRYKCRKAVVKDLEEQGLLEKIDDHEMSLGHCYRCKTVIESYLSDQWFVKMRPLADMALKAQDEGRVAFHPARWEKVYRGWLDNVRDWCISRQIWWGHRIPVWYCDDCGEIMVADKAPENCASCLSKNLRQDEDVLDTWFSSALWPLSTLGWPEQTADLKKFYPTNILITARGIIYFWVARMIMMGLKFTGEVPFSDVYIHGTILDEKGEIMSKSKGNGIDPIEMIGQYGADAVRFSLMMLTTEGQDIKLSPQKFEMGRNFANKIWNASRFILTNMSERVEGEILVEGLELEDRWILSRLNKTIETVSGTLNEYRYNELAKTLYDFIWHDFCDWYLELTKSRLRSEEKAGVVRLVLVHVLDRTLRMIQPLMPFIAEELWEKLGEVSPHTGRIIVAEWPKPQPEMIFEEDEKAMSFLQDVIRAVRNIRAEMEIGKNVELNVVISAVDKAEADVAEKYAGVIKAIAKVSELEAGVGLEKPENSAAAVLGTTHLYVPLEGLIDVEAEKAKLSKKLEDQRRFLQIVNKKLENKQFVERANPEVVELERNRKIDLEKTVERLEGMLKEL